MRVHQPGDDRRAWFVCDSNKPAATEHEKPVANPRSLDEDRVVLAGSECVRFSRYSNHRGTGANSVGIRLLSRTMMITINPTAQIMFVKR
jgi:hypothetical protein